MLSLELLWALLWFWVLRPGISAALSVLWGGLAVGVMFPQFAWCPAPFVTGPSGVFLSPESSRFPCFTNRFLKPGFPLITSKKLITVLAVCFRPETTYNSTFICTRLTRLYGGGEVLT